MSTATNQLTLEQFLARANRRRVRKVDEDVVHGVQLDSRYHLAKVRYNRRQWVKVWAIYLPANGAAPRRLFVAPCSLLPKGGWWRLGQAYFLELDNVAS